MKHMVTTMIVQVLWFLLAPAQLFFHLVPLPPLVAAASAVSPPPPMAAPRPGCPSVCGDVRIPYPFGVGVDCAWAKGYDTTCNHSFNPPRPYLGNIEVMDISVETGEMRVFSPLSYACYNSSNTTARRGVLNLQLDFTDTMLYISPMRNQFTAIGCSTLARLKGMKDWSYYTGCISYCESIGGAADDGDNCTGLGCCQTSIPDNLTRARLFWRKKRSKLGSNSAWTFSPCNYAFIGTNSTGQTSNVMETTAFEAGLETELFRWCLTGPLMGLANADQRTLRRQRNQVRPHVLVPTASVSTPHKGLVGTYASAPRDTVAIPTLAGLATAQILTSVSFENQISPSTENCIPATLMPHAMTQTVITSAHANLDYEEMVKLRKDVFP